MSSNYENENNRSNGIHNMVAMLGRCNVERQDTPNHHQATVTKRKRKTKRGRNRNENMKIARRIGTWNVRTFPQSGKLANVIKEMEKVKVGNCMNRRMRNSVLDCMTDPGADCGCDHQLLVACV